MDPMAPRELHFSHKSTQLRAFLVDDSHDVAVAADNPCSICGHRLNNIAFYATEPDTFYVHVGCALHFPPPPPLPGSCSNRSISQQANPNVPQTYVNPSHMNSFANNYNFYRPPVPNYPQTGPSVPNYLQPGLPVSNYPQPWPSAPNYLQYVPPVPNTLQYVQPNYLQYVPPVPNTLQYVPPNYLQYVPPVPNTLQYVPPVPNKVQSAPYSQVYPANSSTGNYVGSAGRIGGVLGQLGTTVLGSFLEALFDKMFDEISF